MNTKQENTLSMYYGFVEFIHTQQAITNDFPFFPDIYARFFDAVEGIKSLRVIQEGDKTGATLDKGSLREKLEADALQLSKQLVALAALKNNQTLWKEASYKPTDLKRAQDTVIKDISELLLKHANNNLADLAAFGTTQDKLTALKSTIDAYAASISKPKQSINDRARATQQIESLFEVADEQLKLMSKVVDAVSDNHPDFYDGFRRATKVVNLGTKGMSLRASTTDAEGNPLSHVTVEILSQRPNARTESGTQIAPSPMVTKKTSEKGTFRVQNLPDGSYVALAKKLGFKDQEIQFHVVKGEMVDLSLTLESI